MSAAHSLSSLVEAAVARRDRLIASGVTDAYRLVNGSADHLPGWVMERLGSVLIVQLHEGKTEAPIDVAREAVQKLLQRFSLRAAYLKLFLRDRSQATDEQRNMLTAATPWIGDPVEPEIPVREFNAKFMIRPYDGFSCGLFLEHRENRRTLGDRSRGRRVLNLFCYTCGFSVTAALGGATEVTSVDLSKRYLDWGRSNFRLNGLDAAAHRFICGDVNEFYKRAERQGLRYDLLVIDPPTFARMRRPTRTFVLEKQIGPLLEGAVRLLNPGGLIFFATNNRALNPGRIVREVHRASGPRKARVMECPSLPPDFADDPDYSLSLWAKVD